MDAGVDLGGAAPGHGSGDAQGDRAAAAAACEDSRGRARDRLPVRLLIEIDAAGAALGHGDCAACGDVEGGGGLQVHVDRRRTAHVERLRRVEPAPAGQDAVVERGARIVAHLRIADQIDGLARPRIGHFEPVVRPDREGAVRDLRARRDLHDGDAPVLVFLARAAPDLAHLHLHLAERARDHQRVGLGLAEIRLEHDSAAAAEVAREGDAARRPVAQRQSAADDRVLESRRRRREGDRGPAVHGDDLDAGERHASLRSGAEGQPVGSAAADDGSSQRRAALHRHGGVAQRVAERLSGGRGDAGAAAERHCHRLPGDGLRDDRRPGAGDRSGDAERNASAAAPARVEADAGVAGSLDSPPCGDIDAARPADGREYPVEAASDGSGRLDRNVARTRALGEDADAVIGVGARHGAADLNVDGPGGVREHPDVASLDAAGRVDADIPPAVAVGVYPVSGAGGPPRGGDRHALGRLAVGADPGAAGARRGHGPGGHDVDHPGGFHLDSVVRSGHVPRRVDRDAPGSVARRLDPVAAPGNGSGSRDRDRPVPEGSRGDARTARPLDGAGRADPDCARARRGCVDPRAASRDARGRERQAGGLRRRQNPLTRRADDHPGGAHLHGAGARTLGEDPDRAGDGGRGHGDGTLGVGVDPRPRDPADAARRGHRGGSRAQRDRPDAASRPRDGRRRDGHVGSAREGVDCADPVEVAGMLRIGGAEIAALDGSRHHDGDGRARLASGGSNHLVHRVDRVPLGGDLQSGRRLRERDALLGRQVEPVPVAGHRDAGGRIERDFEQTVAVRHQRLRRRQRPGAGVLLVGSVGTHFGAGGAGLRGHQPQGAERERRNRRHQPGAASRRRMADHRTADPGETAAAKPPGAPPRLPPGQRASRRRACHVGVVCRHLVFNSVSRRRHASRSEKGRALKCDKG